MIVNSSFSSKCFVRFSARHSKSNTDIIRALLVLRLCGIDPIVKNNQKILSILRATLGQSLFKKILKGTFFGHFVAGERAREAVEPVVARLKRYGVKSILDYSVESDLSSEQAVQTAKSSQLAAEVAPAVRAFLLLLSFLHSFHTLFLYSFNYFCMCS
ncbi:hypothetical protein COOONC_17243 [Cooperia oncophora]